MAEPYSHVCKRGDHLFRIAKERGVSHWSTIWNHSKNADLKAKRTPHMFLVGDVVVVPQGQDDQVAGATEKNHPFVIPEKKPCLRIRVLREDFSPLAKAEYHLWVDQEFAARTGKTDKNGMFVEKAIPETSKEAKLTVRTPTSKDKSGALVGGGPISVVLGIGKLHPIEKLESEEKYIPGVQQRLNNLGFDSGPLVDQLYAQNRGAIREFCETFGLSDRDRPDESFLQKLREVHDHPKKGTKPAKKKK